MYCYVSICIHVYMYVTLLGDSDCEVYLHAIESEHNLRSLWCAIFQCAGHVSYPATLVSRDSFSVLVICIKVSRTVTKL